MLANRDRMPSMLHFREYALSGALFSYGPSFLPGCRRAGEYVARIPNGAKPADLPIEQADQV